MTVPPNRGGPVRSFGTYRSAEAALRAFVETQGTPGSPVPEPSLTRRGYQELTLAGGSIVYAYEPTPDFFATAIHVVETDGGWTVADGEASGC
jgi:hypothetical protein